MIWLSRSFIKSLYQYYTAGMCGFSDTTKWNRKKDLAKTSVYKWKTNKKTYFIVVCWGRIGPASCVNEKLNEGMNLELFLFPYIFRLAAVSVSFSAFHSSKKSAHLWLTDCYNARLQGSKPREEPQPQPLVSRGMLCHRLQSEEGNSSTSKPRHTRDVCVELLVSCRQLGWFPPDLRKPANYRMSYKLDEQNQ